MKEIFKLSKKEKKTVKKILQNELQRYYSEDEAEILMNKVLDGRDKVQEALEAYERAYTEYIGLEEKVGVVLRKRHFTPYQLSEYKLPDFVCLVGNEGETYLDLNYRLGVHGPKPEKDVGKTLNNFDKYLKKPIKISAEKECIKIGGLIVETY